MSMITESPAKCYLGDGVYADIENNMIKLTAENGVEATNTIWFEPEVAVKLMEYLKDKIKSA